MESYYTAGAVAFGLIIGSFVNVLIHRLPRGQGVVRGRSHCPACGQLIVWYDNLPVASYLLLRGRCRSCRARIPLRYLVVEVLTGTLFGLAFAAVRGLPGVGGALWTAVGFAVMAAFLAALVAAAFIDLAHQILPDEITKTGMWAAPVCSLIFPWIVVRHFDPRELGLAVSGVHAVGLLGSVLGLLGGAGFIWVIGVVGRWVFRKEAMGLGDVKFMGMIGGFLGPGPVIMVVFIACLFGSLVGITIFVLTRGRYLAFGPYLALGAAIMLLFGDSALWLVKHWWPTVFRSVIG